MTVLSIPLPVSTVVAKARPLSQRATDLEVSIQEMFNSTVANPCVRIENVYTEADAQTLRTLKEGAKRPASTEKAVKIRSVGTTAGRAASKLELEGFTFSCRVADAGDGAVYVWLVKDVAKAKAD